MAIDRFVLRAVISLSFVCGIQASVFELPASAMGQPTGVGPYVLSRPGQFGTGTEAWQNERNPGAEGDIAVEFALSQVGKPYVYGAAGPYGYDCSGLALASWRVAGVELPRTASAQYYAGSHVPLGELQPGDLIFWASDVSGRPLFTTSPFLWGETGRCRPRRRANPWRWSRCGQSGSCPWRRGPEEPARPLTAQRGYIERCCGPQATNVG